MYNPFPLLDEPMLADKIRKGKRYFVRQTFTRGKTAAARLSLLLRAYEEEEKETANRHFHSLVGDANAFLYDLSEPGHLQRLQTAAKQPSGFRIFYAGKKGEDWKPPLPYEQKIKRYIRLHHGGWRPKKGGEKIEVGLFEDLGQLFLKFSFQGEEDSIPFEQIEKS